MPFFFLLLVVVIMMIIMCTLLMTVVFVWKGAERSVPVSTMTAALDTRYLSARKTEVSNLVG